MGIAYSSLALLAIMTTACGSSEPSGATPQTSRFNEGTFALIQCKDPKGQDGLALDMVVAGDKITALKVRQGQKLINTFGFGAASERETDEGVVTDVKLANSMAFWNLEQGILVVKRPDAELLSGTSCTISNKRVWESLSL